MTRAANADRTGGRSETFDSAVRQLMPELLRYFVRRVDPTEDAADCLSETLVILWRRNGQLPRQHDSLRAWAFTVAKNVLRNHRRSQARSFRLSSRLRDELLVWSPPDRAVADDLSATLASLSDEDRELVTLVAWDGFGVAEAGAVLGLKAEAARARYSRARLALRTALRDEVMESTPSKGNVFNNE